MKKNVPRMSNKTTALHVRLCRFMGHESNRLPNPLNTMSDGLSVRMAQYMKSLLWEQA